MMNGRGKSDRSIVPEKPPNEAERTAEEVRVAGLGQCLAEVLDHRLVDLVEPSVTQARHDVPLHDVFLGLKRGQLVINATQAEVDRRKLLDRRNDRCGRFCRRGRSRSVGSLVVTSIAVSASDCTLRTCARSMSMAFCLLFSLLGVLPLTRNVRIWSPILTLNFVRYRHRFPSR
jgi:hypothetical protein